MDSGPFFNAEHQCNHINQLWHEVDRIGHFVLSAHCTFQYFKIVSRGNFISLALENCKVWGSARATRSFTNAQIA